ncbi:hypothetical protein [Pseudoxanthomonas winnipegensis]|uniref:Uncharacterized protein n=1 Tax=Pseudoxanthomonas winnipegensis TaxID=2480810 RepID=A0A4Q8M2M9_9GAMM|nr:hypothetical protein [Pseudoxanthomonas winnipegensis]TAA41583.1 hypothetical protein EA655_11625 [Pseudoxanthomonas winnipegensis]
MKANRSTDEAEQKLQARYAQEIKDAEDARNNKDSKTGAKLISMGAAAQYLKMSRTMLSRLNSSGQGPESSTLSTSKAPNAHKSYTLDALDAYVVNKSSQQQKSQSKPTVSASALQDILDRMLAMEEEQRMMRKILMRNGLMFTTFAQLDMPVDFAMNPQGQILGLIEFIEDDVLDASPIVTMSTRDALEEPWASLEAYTEVSTVVEEFVAEQVQWVQAQRQHRVVMAEIEPVPEKRKHIYI